MTPGRDLLAMAMAACLGAAVGWRTAELATPAAAAAGPPPVAARSSPPDRPAASAAAPRGAVAATLALEERQRPAADKLAALDAPLRDAMLPPAAVLDLLGVAPGMAVLDVGAGGGRLAVPLARHVGADGVVHASDLDPAMVAVLAQRAAGLPALRPRLVTGGIDPFYRAVRVDRVVMCSVYEYLHAPIPFLRVIAQALRPGGRLLLLQGRSDAHYLPFDFAQGFDLAALRTSERWAPVWRALPPTLRVTLATLPPAALAQPVQAPLREVLAGEFYRVVRLPGLASELARARGLLATPAALATLAPGPDALVVAWIAAHHPAALAASAASDEITADLHFRLLLGLFGGELARELFPRGIYLRPDDIGRRLAAAGLRPLPAPAALSGHDVLLWERPGGPAEDPGPRSER